MRYCFTLIIGILVITLAWFAGYQARASARNVPRVAMLYTHTFGPDIGGVWMEELLAFDMVASGALPPVHLEHYHVDNSNITKVVKNLYNHGVKSFVGLLLSSNLAQVEDFAVKHPDALFYSTSSTAARFNSISNMIRLASPDSRTIPGWKHLANLTMQQRDVVVAYTEGDVWSVDLATMLLENLGGIVRSISRVEDIYLSSLEFTGQVLISLTSDIDTFLTQHISHTWLQADVVFGDGAAYVQLPDIPQWRNSTNMKAFVIANNARDVSHLPASLLHTATSPFVSELVRALQIATTVEYLRADGVFEEGFSIQSMYGVDSTNLLDDHNNRNQLYFELGYFHVEPYASDAQADNSTQGRLLQTVRAMDDWVLEDHELEWFLGNGKYARRTCADAARVIVQENDGITWYEDLSTSDYELRKRREDECNDVREWARYWLMVDLLVDEHYVNEWDKAPLTEATQFGDPRQPPEEWEPYLWFGEFYNWDNCEEIAHYRARRGDSSPFANESYDDRRRVFESQCNAARTTFSTRFAQLVRLMKKYYSPGFEPAPSAVCDVECKQKLMLSCPDC